MFHYNISGDQNCKKIYTVDVRIRFYVLLNQKDFSQTTSAAVNNFRKCAETAVSTCLMGKLANRVGSHDVSPGRIRRAPRERADGRCAVVPRKPIIGRHYTRRPRPIHGVTLRAAPPRTISPTTSRVRA